MNKLNFETVDTTESNISKIAELFPNVVTEDENGKSIDFELLRQELSSQVVEGNKERYQLTWPGKKEAILMANTPINKTLRPIEEKSVGFANTENVYIEGDNLEALKILQESYLNKIKMIYIDPPYNTGKDFIYKDKFSKNSDEELLDSGQIDEYGNRLVVNADSSGKYHSDWLSMMYPRLKLARNLLADDGVIFISIDDKELFNLKKMCDEIYGENNYINTVSVNAKVSAGASGGGEDKRLKKNVEYVLIYAKDFASIDSLPTLYKESELMDYIRKMKLDNKSFKYTNVLYKMTDVEEVITIKDGFGDDIKVSKVNDYEIKSVKQVARLENISEEEVYNRYYDKIMTTTNAQTSIRNRVWEATEGDKGMFIASFTSKSGKNKGNIKEYIFVGKQKVLVIWLRDTTIKKDCKIYKQEKIGTYWDGFSWINVTKEGNVRFENGKKPIDFIIQNLTLANCKDNDIILDFFSGSGSTAHAVMEYNKNKQTKLKYIMIQIPEVVKDKEYLKYLSEEKMEPIITDIAEERIRRAGSKIKEDTNADIDYGFRVFKVDSSNMKDIFYKPSDLGQENLFDLMSNIKEDRTSVDLLTQVILDLGLTLDLKMEEKKLINNNVYYVADNALVACFDDNVDIDIVDEICKCKPLKVVFKDASFKTDKDKINLEERIKKLSADTEISIL